MFKVMVFSRTLFRLQIKSHLFIYIYRRLNSFIASKASPACFALAPKLMMYFLHFVSSIFLAKHCPNSSHACDKKVAQHRILNYKNTKGQWKPVVVITESYDRH